MQNGGVASTPDSLGFPEAFGVRERRVELYKRTIAALPPDLEAYRKLGIEWFVVGPDDRLMLKNVEAWAAGGKVREVNSFDRWGFTRK